jgi:predicted MPP superfamily phosphohydrolase
MLLEPHGLDMTSSRFVLRESQSPQAIVIAQVSDLHLRSFGRHAARIAEAANGMKPDLIAITGDAIDDRSGVPELDTFLSSLDRETPKLAIAGNWEYWAALDMSALARLYEKHNCRLLVNASAAMKIGNTTLSFIGLDDLIAGRPDIPAAFSSAPEADAQIILAHCPQLRDILTDHRALMISGHTHGGQIALPGFAPFVPPGSGDYLSGRYETANGPLYVSRGLGTSTVALRFNSIPELARLEVVV